MMLVGVAFFVIGSVMGRAIVRGITQSDDTMQQLALPGTMVLV